MNATRYKKDFAVRFFKKFADAEDPRHQSYTEYSGKVMLGTVYYKGIAGITSMQSMTHEFNDSKIANNIYGFLGEAKSDFLPHGVTINEYLDRLDPAQLQGIQHDCVYDMIRDKTFYEARFRKKWLVIVDGTQLYSGNRQLNDKCLERHFNKGEANETVNYHCNVLEAKIVFGEKLVVSIGSEFIENNGEDAEKIKRNIQDCQLHYLLIVCMRQKQ